MVKAWREIVTIPTYEAGKPEKLPMFLEKRVYQGSSGVVYPYPVVEAISDEKVDKDYQAVWLENEYIKVMVLPELGGRVQMAYDKIAKRHFVYYNHVVKPALVGLLGPWISGGIEFNWPQHHRPSTFMPVDSTIVSNADGSVTVWVNEMERMFHQKGMAGFTLRPGCAYLEIQGRVSNRTSLPQTFLWWANPAVEVNDYYQSVFPPDINAVFDHGKRAVSSFPIATGTYYKMDYSAGVDISNYKNIKVPTSYMGVNSLYDFEGGYENDTHAGMLHVASHHFSPGKKQWTWGNGDFGRAWDRNLTDEVSNSQFTIHNAQLAAQKDAATNNCELSMMNCGLNKGFRPYIELMAGVYTENQPDFTWLMPYEEKQFVQYFMPYREIGIVKQASKDFVMNIESLPSSEKGGQVIFKLQATSNQNVRVELKRHDGTIYYNKVVTLTPEAVLVETVDVGDATLGDLSLTVNRADGPTRLPLLEWHAEPDEIRPIPDAAEAPLSPQETKTVDQLYFTGLHLEQYRHATWSALDYYEEGLRRDPLDYRCNLMTGLWYLRRARFEKAEGYLQTAVRVQKKRNPNPYDGEALFYLGVVSRFLEKPSTAYACFWKSTWSKGWADAGFYEAACISMAETRWEDALDELNRALISNSHNHQARALKAAALRKLGRRDEALAWIRESLAIDPFNYVCMVEESLLTDDQQPLCHMAELMHGNVYNYHEVALDYAHAGLADEAMLVLCTALDNGADTSPLTYYYMAYLCPNASSADYLRQAAAASPDYCFPNRLEDAFILKRFSQQASAGGARASYYLGCLYYDKRQYDEAVSCWERAAEGAPAYPPVWRNLALACFNKGHLLSTQLLLAPVLGCSPDGSCPADNAHAPSLSQLSEVATRLMERAFSLDTSDARMLMELDQLYKRLHRPHQERLDHLLRYPELVEQRDDLVLEVATLLNLLGRYEEAKAVIDRRTFHPWEGGEGKVSGQYQMCRIEIAKQLLKKDPSDGRARQLLEECLVFPQHLGEGKLYGAQDNDFLYFLGRYEEGTQGPTEPAAAMYYNDAKPDKIFYAALCYRKLGQEDRARSLFNKLINYGRQHLFDKVVMDYFAVSLPDLLIWDDSLDIRNRVHCYYMLALGYFGLGDMAHAQKYLAEVEKLDNNHLGAHQLRTFVMS